MTTCNHDPFFTHDGRCCKCYPRRIVVIVQHIDGAVETHPGWAAMSEQRIADVRPLADAQQARYDAWRAELSDDDITLMEEMTRETASEPPTHDGMWK